MTNETLIAHLNGATEAAHNAEEFAGQQADSTFAGVVDPLVDAINNLVDVVHTLIVRTTPR